jgi:hypothetical protein
MTVRYGDGTNSWLTGAITPNTIIHMDNNSGFFALRFHMIISHHHRYYFRMAP